MYTPVTEIQQNPPRIQQDPYTPPYRVRIQLDNPARKSSWIIQLDYPANEIPAEP
jgi:hypothetical protein